MSEEFAVFLLMNNYFHDVATAMLLACAIVIWAVRKAAEGEPTDSAASAYAEAMVRSVMNLVGFSVVWIVASGIVRVCTFQRFEWHNFTDKGIEAGLIVKYVIAVLMMTLGGYLLIRMSRKNR